MIQIDYQQVVKTYAPMMFRLAYGYCCNRSDAEDVVQEVFLKLLEHTPQFENDRQLCAWLMTVTANRCRNLLGSGWKRKTLPLEDAFVSSEDPDESIEVRSALAKLSPKLHSVVHLFYYEQMSVKQIAGILDLPENTVLSRLYLARKQLKKHLGGD